MTVEPWAFDLNDPAGSVAKLALRLPKRDRADPTGQIVLIEPGKFYTDPSSGTTYTDREGWDAICRASKEKPTR
jgi:hypothetical protein